MSKKQQKMNLGSFFFHDHAIAERWKIWIAQFRCNFKGLN